MSYLTPKYLYRARLPAGRVIEAAGKGKVVKFPDELLKKLWIWRVLGYFFRNSFWIYIERKEINKYKETSWQQCFWWPASKLKHENYQ